MDANANLKHIQEYANKFIESAISLYETKLVNRFESLGFIRKKEISDGKLVYFENTYFPVSYNFHKWDSEYGNINWFVLQGTFKHASNIVACLAFPKNSDIPIFSMNLNLKLDAETYSIILGFKSNNHLPQNLNEIIKEINLTIENPIYTDCNSSNFFGTRSSFKITDNIIEKSLQKAEQYVLMWLDLFETEKTDFKKNNDISIITQYKMELEKLHDVEKTVYDELFGDSWLINLFKNEIL